MDLTGQIALVTGAGRGLGRAFAQALAAAGARVGITSRSADELQATAAGMPDGQALTMVADTTDPAAAEKVVTAIEQQLGPITLLVNNAGQFRAFGAVGAVDSAEWWREVEVNLRGPFLYANAALPHMRERRQGRIVNVASGAGLQGMPLLSAYNVSKTALIRLSETMAIETADDGIAVFALDPGTVRTPMNAYVHDSPEVARQAPHVQQWFRTLYAEERDTPIQHAVSLLLRLAAGHADSLSGAFLSVEDDLDALVREQQEHSHPDRHTLRLHR